MDCGNADDGDSTNMVSFSGISPKYGEVNAEKDC